MRLIWHIFIKDARSHWGQALLPLLLLAWLAQCDAGRTGATPGHLEGWLNVLAPLAWSFLVGAVVLEDAPIGDAAAWMTLPVAWHRLLAAKILFALLFVHLPLLVAQSLILGVRGFAPWLAVPQLAAVQIGLLLMLTLPSLALASVVSGLAQFAACAFPLVALLAFLGGPLKFTSWGDQHRLEIGFCVSILAVAAAWMVSCQYRRLYAPWWVRAAGLGAVAAAATLYVWFPRPLAARLKEALSTSPATGSLAVKIASSSQQPPPYMLRPGRIVTVAIPVSTTGWPADNFATIGPIDLALETAQGEQIQAEWPSPNRAGQALRLEGYLAAMPDSTAPAWQILHLHPELYRRLRAGPVKLRARVLVDFLRPLKPSLLLRSQVPTKVPGIGTCGSELLAGYLGGHSMLRVACESPAPIPFGSRVRPVLPGSSGQRTEYLGGATTYSAHPQSAWLSPLHRRDAFLHFQDAGSLSKPKFPPGAG